MAEPKTQTVVKGQQIQLQQNEFTNPSGEIFVEWNTQRDGSGTSYLDQQQVITESELTLYAQWGYQITWNSNGGSNIIPWKRKTNTNLGTLPEPTKSGFDLEGWYTSSSGGSQISSDTTVSGNATYYAHWTGKTWSVTHSEYRGNGYLFNNIPHGTYNFTQLNGIGAYHSGSHTTHVYYPLIQVVNSESTSKYKKYAINGTLKTDYGGYVKIIKNVPVINSGEISYQTGVRFSEMNDTRASFSITNMEITLPYEKNTIKLIGYDEDSCGKWTLLGVYKNSSSEIKAELQRIS